MSLERLWGAASYHSGLITATGGPELMMPGGGHPGEQGLGVLSIPAAGQSPFPVHATSVLSLCPEHGPAGVRPGLRSSKRP